MKYLSQRDPQWASVLLGQSKLTLGRFGCATTCVSMISDYFGAYLSPAELAHNAHNYTADGLVVWKSLAIRKFSFVWRDYKENPEKIAECLKDPDKAVMLQVNDGQHWVVGVRKTLLGNDYVVVDPWTGKKVNAKATYHNVTGAAYFSRY